MSRLWGILAVVGVVLLSMAFAAVNAGHRVTLELGFVTLYRAPVTLVAFGGLLVGMLVMFATGIHSDLKVRRILRERLEEEARVEQRWIDRSQRDLFSQDPEPEEKAAGAGGGVREEEERDPVSPSQAPEAAPAQEPRDRGIE